MPNFVLGPSVLGSADMEMMMRMMTIEHEDYLYRREFFMSSISKLFSRRNPNKGLQSFNFQAMIFMHCLRCLPSKILFADLYRLIP